MTGAWIRGVLGIGERVRGGCGEWGLSFDVRRSTRETSIYYYETSSVVYAESQIQLWYIHETVASALARDGYMWRAILVEIEDYVDVVEVLITHV